MSNEADFQLLELAAKAQGRKPKYMTEHIAGREPETFIACWNPLTDDGDALRLAVKLHMDILHRFVGGQRVEVLAPGGRLQVEYCDSETRQAATRCAIVRAAAEIGKALA